MIKHTDGIREDKNKEMNIFFFNLLENLRILK